MNNKLTNSFLSAYRTNLFDPNGLELNNAIVQQNSNSYIEGSSLESYFGQVNYDYKNTYFIRNSEERWKF
jgi:hypothetical protein